MIKFANNLQMLIKASQDRQPYFTAPNQSDQPYTPDPAEDFELDHFPWEFLALGAKRPKPDFAPQGSYRRPEVSFAAADINESANTQPNRSSVLDNSYLFNPDGSLRYNHNSLYSIRPDGTAVQRAFSINPKAQDLNSFARAQTNVEPVILPFRRTSYGSVIPNTQYAGFASQIADADDILGGPVSRARSEADRIRKIDSESFPGQILREVDGKYYINGKKVDTLDPRVSKLVDTLDRNIGDISITSGLNVEGGGYGRNMGPNLIDEDAWDWGPTYHRQVSPLARQGGPVADVLEGDDRWRPNRKYTPLYPWPQTGVPITLPPELEEFFGPAERKSLVWGIDPKGEPQIYSPIRNLDEPVAMTLDPEKGVPNKVIADFLTIMNRAQQTDDPLTERAFVPDSLIQDSQNPRTFRIVDPNKSTPHLTVDRSILDDPSLSDLDRRILEATIAHEEEINNSTPNQNRKKNWGTFEKAKRIIPDWVRRFKR